MDTWWDLALAAGLLTEHAWLLVLSQRVAIIHRRLARHVCRDPVMLTGRKPD